MTQAPPPVVSDPGEPGIYRPDRRARLDSKVRGALPRPAYQLGVGAYYRARALVGAGRGRGHLEPDFLIIGAAKAGTTSLYAWLRDHPFVRPASQKEVHFFDYNHYRGLNWYRKHFPLRAERESFASEHGQPFLTGEASPTYIAHEWAPERVARHLPDVKLLVSLRDPVDRAFSQFQMSRREHEEPLESFADAVAAEAQRLAPELARTRRDRRYKSWPLGCWSYLHRSRYDEQLERWLGLFDRRQFHIVTLEELSADPQGTMDGIHEFLGLPTHTYASLRPRFQSSYGAIPPALRERLDTYFRPHNERTYEFVGRDLGWGAGSG